MFTKIIDCQFKLLKELKRKEILMPVFIGEKGQGKTHLVKKYCEDLNLELFILNLATIESSDFTGIPYNDNGITKYAMPEFFRMKKGILFLDEINRVNDSDVKSGLLSLLNDRMINGHKLSDSVLIVGAGNPDNDSYETNTFDEALKDRILVIPFNRTYKDFIDYLESTHKSSDLLTFYKLNQDSLKEYSFRRLERTLDFFEVNQSIDEIAFYLSGNILNLFREFLSKNLVTIDDLLKGKIKVEIDSIAEKKLMLEVVNLLSANHDFSVKESKNINAFLNDSLAENKMLFFTEIQKIALTDKNFEEKKATWKEKKLFDGLKEYLDTYLK